MLGGTVMRFRATEGQMMNAVHNPSITVTKGLIGARTVIAAIILSRSWGRVRDQLGIGAPLLATLAPAIMGAAVAADTEGLAEVDGRVGRSSAEDRSLLLQCSMGTRRRIRRH